MRRLVVLSVSVAALAAPAVATALQVSASDGSLVVRNASGPDRVPVVQLQITGAAIGYVDSGRIVIDPGASAEVTGYDWHRNSSTVDTAQVWGGQQFKFRAVGGHFTILIYGSGIDVSAVGRGSVTLTGLPATTADGTYSLNGKDFRSLPGVSSGPLSIGSSSDSTG